MDSLVFDSDDLDVTEDFLCRAYARLRIGHGGAKGVRTCMRRGVMPAVNVDELAMNYEMDYAVTPLGRLGLCTVHEGTIEDNSFHGIRDTYGPGDIGVSAPADLPYSGRLRGARYNVTMLDPDLLTQVAGPGPGGTEVRLTGHRPHGGAAARHLAHLIVHLRDQVLCDPVLRQEPLLVSTGAQMPAAAVLAAFPHAASTNALAQDRRDARSLTSRRAVAYIDDQPTSRSPSPTSLLRRM